MRRDLIEFLPGFRQVQHPVAISHDNDIRNQTEIALVLHANCILHVVLIYECPNSHCTTGVVGLIAYQGTIVEQAMYLLFEILGFGFESADTALQQCFGLAQIAETEGGKWIFRMPPGYNLHGSDHSHVLRLSFRFADRLLDVLLDRKEIFRLVKPQRAGFDTAPDFEHLLFSVIEVLV